MLHSTFTVSSHVSILNYIFRRGTNCKQNVSLNLNGVQTLTNDMHVISATLGFETVTLFHILFTKNIYISMFPTHYSPFALFLVGQYCYYTISQ